jgi:cysteine synthase B
MIVRNRINTPEDSTQERTQTMRAYGATAGPTSAKKGFQTQRPRHKSSRRDIGSFNQFATRQLESAPQKTTGTRNLNDTHVEL